MVPAHAIALTGSDQAVRNAGPGLYRGFAVRETGSAVATIRIYDNASAASGVLLDTIELAALESAREWYGADGIWFVNGIYVDIVAGAVEGSVRVG